MNAAFTAQQAAEDAGAIAKRLGSAYGLHPADILGTRRPAPLVAARHELYAEMWRAGYGIAEIGRALDRHHTTIMHGLRRAMGDAAYESEIAARYPLPGYVRIAPPPATEGAA